jgi:hypothetical protein
MMAGFIEHSQIVTTNNYNSLKITVAMAHKIKISVLISLVVAR